MVSTEDAADRHALGAGDRRRRRRARGAARRCDDNTATVTVEWDPERVADHTGVTATFGDTLAPGAHRRPGRRGRPVLARGVRGHRFGGHRRPASRWSRAC